ncbi:MAG: Ribosome-associated ATPase RbbA [Rhodanobacteraceae bacterium]|jgi:ABC-2 type transport system ATP-binding protein|nr:MAG: Ribosome-associated ATPase RbbA [Rhodanobacteraceae bacterium]
MNALAPTTPLVRAAGLSKRFGDVQAVDALGFGVAAGEIFGLVGPDGAGKTTTLRMLAGVLDADAGEAVVDGVDVMRQPEEAKLHSSYMPQRFGLYEDLTVGENIRFYADLFDVAPAVREGDAARLLHAAGMEGFRNRFAGQLSGGMKQKLGLCCALIHTPKVLLLDEPTTGVDPVSRREFWTILYGLRAQGVAIVISTAYLDEAERCDRLGLLHAGRMILSGTPDALKTHMPGTVLAITCADPRAAHVALENAEGLASLLLVGDGVHAVVDDAARRIPELRQRLAQHGIAAADLRVTPPSVEDLFVALLQQDTSHDH